MKLFVLLGQAIDLLLSLFLVKLELLLNLFMFLEDLLRVKAKVSLDDAD